MPEKIEIGQKIISQGFGEVTVVDKYLAVSNPSKVAYEIDDGLTTWLVEESDLIREDNE